MKILAIVGSIRKDSHNLKLARYIQRRYEDRFHLTIADIASLPHYNQDCELTPPASVTALREQVKNADAVLWITPEYNYSIPGVMKNAIDWLSRVERVLQAKPSWIMGVSAGKMGTLRAQLHLREILFALNSPLLPRNEIYIAAANEVLDADGSLRDAALVTQLDTVVENCIHWIASLPQS